VLRRWTPLWANGRTQTGRLPASQRSLPARLPNEGFYLEDGLMPNLVLQTCPFFHQLPEILRPPTCTLEASAWPPAEPVIGTRDLITPAPDTALRAIAWRPKEPTAPF